MQAWQWAQADRSGNGSLPTGKDIGRRHSRHERWGRLVKRSGLAGELTRKASRGPEPNRLAVTEGRPAHHPDRVSRLVLITRLDEG